jgi:hypothetical protein
MNRLLLSVAIGVFLIARANAGIFQLEFDNVGNGLPLNAPIVGTGTVSWTGPNVDGTFPVLSLPNFDVMFDFGGDTFTLADATTPLSEVLVLVSGNGTELFFSNTGAVSGGFLGAFDFVDGDMSNATNSILSFEPPGFSQPPPSLYYVGNRMSQTYFGDYDAVSSTVVPEPMALTVWGSLMIVGFVIPRRTRARRKA